MLNNKGKEIRVYVVNADADFDFLDAKMLGKFDDIISEAERQGTIYSLEGFQEAINCEDLFLTNSFIYIAEA